MLCYPPPAHEMCLPRARHRRVERVRCIAITDCECDAYGHADEPDVADCDTVDTDTRRDHGSADHRSRRRCLSDVQRLRLSARALRHV